MQVQLTRLESRLRVFAAWQARHRRDGWRITRTEWALPRGTVLEVPDQRPMPITGTVDRVDVREDRSATMVIDYKTSEQANTPEKTHRRDGRWTDLQLPLYRHLLPAGEIQGEITLAYVALPRDLKKVGLLAAEWTDDEHADAIDCARQVVRDIRAGRFEMSDDFPVRYRDEFETICQSTVFAGAETTPA